MSDFTIRQASLKDSDAIIALLPRLAEFEVPPNRQPEELWHGDRDWFLQWQKGEAPNCNVFVAVDSNDQIVGTAMVTLREEMMSHKPSAHLEVLALAKSAEGQGLGKKLIDTSETYAKDNGAQSMTLHVFSVNARARALYEKCGFDGELIRYSKPL